MTTVTTASVEQTQSVAAAVGRLAAAGDLVLLSGDLGAGKTAFVKGFAAELGVTEPVTSPTFTLAQQYHGRMIVHHLDVYRLSQLSEVVDLAIPELLDGDTVTLIEWGDVIVSALPADYLQIAFTFGDGDDDRLLDFKTTGPQWAPRRRTLHESLTPWMVVPC